MIKVTQSGNFNKTKKFLKRNKSLKPLSLLKKYGEKGVAALQNATPVNTGETTYSWRYEIVKTKYGYNLEFYNDHTTGTTPVVILIQYGHATRNGGWVEGVDFINPAMKSVFDNLSYELWEEVSKP